MILDFYCFNNNSFLKVIVIIRCLKIIGQQALQVVADVIQLLW